jgi:hypothetical protein
MNTDPTAQLPNEHRSPTPLMFKILQDWDFVFFVFLWGGDGGVRVHLWPSVSICVLIARERRSKPQVACASPDNPAPDSDSSHPPHAPVTAL